MGSKGLIRFWVSVMVRVRVNYVRDSFSVLLRARAHHYSMLMTFVSATTANDIEPNKGVDPDTKVGGTAYMSTQREVLEGQTGSH